MSEKVHLLLDREDAKKVAALWDESSRAAVWKSVIHAARDALALLPPKRGGWVVVYHEQPGPGIEVKEDVRSRAFANPTDARERALELNAVSKWGLHTVRHDKHAFVNQEE